MLGTSALTAFLATANAKDCKAFYVKTLGLRFVEQDQFVRRPGVCQNGVQALPGVGKFVAAEDKDRCEFGPVGQRIAEPIFQGNEAGGGGAVESELAPGEFGAFADRPRVGEGLEEGPGGGAVERVDSDGEAQMFERFGEAAGSGQSAAEGGAGRGRIGPGEGGGLEVAQFPGQVGQERVELAPECGGFGIRVPRRFEQPQRSRCEGAALGVSPGNQEFFGFGEGGADVPCDGLGIGLRHGVDSGAG